MPPRGVDIRLDVPIRGHAIGGPGGDDVIRAGGGAHLINGTDRNYEGIIGWRSVGGVVAQPTTIAGRDDDHDPIEP